MRAKLGPLAVGTSVFLGIAYWDYWLRVRGIHNSYLLRQYERIIDGSAPAPDQYRPLVPKMAQLVSHAMSLETAIGAVESGVGVCAAIALFVFAQRRRVGPIGYVLACFACGWWALSLAFYPRPEPLAALLAVTIVAVGATLDGWRRRSVLAFGACWLAHARTYCSRSALASRSSGYVTEDGSSKVSLSALLLRLPPTYGCACTRMPGI